MKQEHAIILLIHTSPVFGKLLYFNFPQMSDPPSIAASPLTIGGVSRKGYPIEVLNAEGNLDPKYLCSLCELVLRQPVQSFCGHRFCQSCVTDFIA